MIIMDLMKSQQSFNRGGVRTEVEVEATCFADEGRGPVAKECGRPTELKQTREQLSPRGRQNKSALSSSL